MCKLNECFLAFHESQLKVSHYAGLKDGSLAELVRKRYQSFDTEIGAQIEVKFFLHFPCQNI